MLPDLLLKGGPMLWVILLASAVAVAVFIERVLHYHRAQISSVEFLNGVKTVLKRDNIVEAVSICDATPGPVARLVKTALLSRDFGRERVRESLVEAGDAETVLLEERLGLLASIVTITPLLGLLGTLLGFIHVFMQLKSAGPAANIASLSGGVSEALVCAAAGLAVAIPAHLAYNYLVNRLNQIVGDMEKAASEIVKIVGESPAPKVS